MPSMGYWAPWRCRSAKDWTISASPQSSTAAPAYCSGSTGYTPVMTPFSAIRYPFSVTSSLPGDGAEMILPLRMVVIGTPFQIKERPHSGRS